MPKEAHTEKLRLYKVRDLGDEAVFAEIYAYRRLDAHVWYIDSPLAHHHPLWLHRFEFATYGLATNREAALAIAYENLLLESQRLRESIRRVGRAHDRLNWLEEATRFDREVEELIVA